MASTTLRPRPLLTGLATTAAALVALVAPVGAATVLAAAPAAADGGAPPGRRIVDHRVRPGETATGLAVRYHAWTAELVARNHLGPDARLRVGQRLEIPVVLAALPPHRPHTGHDRPVHHRAHHRAAHHRATHRAHHRATHRADPGRAAVRRTVARTAARHGVDPHLALAVSWQESGWQMDRRSDAGALGAMQVLPATGRWMSLYEHRRLRLHRLADNATAGVRLLRVLGDRTGSRRHLVAAYYQGLGAVREHGLFRDTRHYVDNVLAIRHRLEAGRPPA